MRSQVVRWGNALAVQIPESIVKALNLRADDAIAWTIEDEKAVLRPVSTLPELTLGELLAQVVEQPEAEVDWGEPMGQEEW